MDAYDEIQSLVYSAWDHVEDFGRRLEIIDIEEPQLFFGSHQEGDTPVVDVIAEGSFNTYINSYRLEGLSMEAFEEEGYQIWKETFEDSYGDSRPLEDFFIQ